MGILLNKCFADAVLCLKHGCGYSNGQPFDSSSLRPDGPSNRDQKIPSCQPSPATRANSLEAFFHSFCIPKEGGPPPPTCSLRSWLTSAVKPDMESAQQSVNSRNQAGGEGRGKNFGNFKKEMLPLTRAVLDALGWEKMQREAVTQIMRISSRLYQRMRRLGELRRALRGTPRPGPASIMRGSHSTKASALVPFRGMM